MKIIGIRAAKQFWQKYSIVFMLALAAASLFGVFYYKSLPLAQFQILSILSIGFLSWAFVHHHFDKSLTLEIILEYVLIAFLALVILYDLIV